MKLLRLKITDPKGFRSLPCGFEHHFRTEWSLQYELEQANDFAPFICAGPNGSGKSNLLEVLAAIFFQLEVLRVRRSFLPEVLQEKSLDFSPVAFELDYLIKLPKKYQSPDIQNFASVAVFKKEGESPQLSWENKAEFLIDGLEFDQTNGEERDLLLPQYILGYSSGENEILSLPFFKTRFVQFDEYWNALTKQLPYPGHPETRLVYLDNGFSQAILLCNLLFQDDATLQPFREDVGIEELKEFRILIRRSIPLTRQQEREIFAFGDVLSGDNVLSGYAQDSYDNAAIGLDPETGNYRLKLLHGLEGNERTSIIEKLKRCATLHFHDEATDTLILDYWVNERTKDAFRDNFDGSALSLFQALQVLLTLNLYSVSDALKADLYTSTSHYVSETVPTLASDQRIMRFKSVRFTKQGVAQPMMLKELSDGEHQLLHSLGLCLLFRNTNSLFLLDEPETHFNPDWRANFISRLRQCLPSNGEFAQEMLITTHTPFLISDSKPEKILVFKKQDGNVTIKTPEYNTLGASINLITMETFNKQETIGAHAKTLLQRLLSSEFYETDPHDLAKLIIDTLGDSIERSIAVQEVLGRGKQQNSLEKDK